MVQTTREIETAMKHLRPTIGQEHYPTEMSLQTLPCVQTDVADLAGYESDSYTTLGGKKSSIPNPVSSRC